jgi:nucleoporin NDC1
LDVLEDINTRITDKKVAPSETTLIQSQDTSPQGLPRLSAPLKQGAVLSPSRPADWKGRNASRARELAKSFGQTPDTGSPLKTLAIAARDKALTPEQQNAFTYEKLRLQLVYTAQEILKVPYLGVPFRQTFASRSRAKVLGAPTSEKEIILRAIGSLSCLAAASVNDDRYGIVHKDIPLIVRTFVNIIGAIEKFIRQSPVHWTDVEFTEEDEDARTVPEIEEVLEHLRASLSFLLMAFENYASDMGLGPIELREAKKAAGL